MLKVDQDRRWALIDGGGVLRKGTPASRLEVVRAAGYGQPQTDEIDLVGRERVDLPRLDDAAHLHGDSAGPTCLPRVAPAKQGHETIPLLIVRR